MIEKRASIFGQKRTKMHLASNFRVACSVSFMQFFVASKVEMSMFNRVYFSKVKCQIIKCWFYWSGKNDGNHH